MQEVLESRMHSSTEGFDIRRVVLFIDSHLIPLSGTWQWDMTSFAVYCSDVMAAFPLTFEGTKGIIHPEDLSGVKAAVEQIEKVKQVNLKFRIITTYGEIKTLTGQHIFLSELAPQELALPDHEQLRAITEQIELRKELASLRQKNLVFEEAAKICGNAIWYYNKSTQEVYYSDQIYLFHGLAPQSINAHLNTFTRYIHPQDRDAVQEAIEQALTEELPLHLEYRILTENDVERYLRNVLQWTFTDNGQKLLQGIVQDYTTQKESEDFLQKFNQQVWFLKKRLQFSESNSHSGFWQLDLVTRRFTPSNNFYYIYGLKPQPFNAGLSLFINYVHPEDRELVDTFYHKLKTEHKADDIEYRIIRPDGKQRYVSLQAKSVIDENKRLSLFGTIQDITHIKSLEKKLREKNESYQLFQYRQSITENLAHIGTWWWDHATKEHFWSDGMYQLLGLKPQSIFLNQNYLLKQIHPDYRNAFTNSLNRTLEDEEEANCELVISSNGVSRRVKALFKLLHYENKRIFIGLFQDISKEHQLQEELSERIQLADLLTEHLPDRILITDNENNILFWNRHCERYYKQKRELVLGKNFFETFPALQTEEKIRQFNNVLKGHPFHQTGAHTVLTKDIMDLHMLPLYDDNKNVVGILHILHDVTEEHKLRQNLTERLQFIQSMIEASVDRVVVLDRHMNYTYWNKRAEEYYNLPKERVLGKNILEVFPAFINDPSYNEFRKALRGEIVYIPTDATNIENAQQYFETYLVPVKGTNDEVRSVLWITHDLSQEYELIAQQQRSADIINLVNAIFIETDLEYRFKYINKKAEEYFGRTHAEMLGQVFWDIAPEAIGTEGHRAIVAACEKRIKVETEYFSQLFKRWVFLSATPSPGGVIILMYDRQDIKDVQEKLQASEALLQRSEEVAAIGSYEFDLATSSFRFSNGMFRLFGETPQSFEPTVDFVNSRSYPRDIEEVNQIIEQSIIDNQPYHYTQRIYNAKGETRTIEVHGRVISDEEGKAIKLIGLAQDITARLAAQAERQKNLTLLQQTEEIAATGSWEYTIDTGIFLWSDGMYQMFNIPPGTPVQPEVYLPISIPEDEYKAQRIVDHLTKHFTPFEEILQIQIAGKIRTIKCKGTPIYNDQKQVQKLVGIDMDITDLVTAENEILKGQHFLQQVTDTAPDAITVFDLSQNKASYINPPVIEGLLGYSVSEMKKMGFEGRLKKIIHPEDQQALVDFNKHLREASIGEVVTLEYRVITKKGKTKWLINRGKSFISNEPGHPKMILSVLQDITVQKQAALELQENRQFMEEVMNASLDFIMVFDFTVNRITYVSRQAYKDDEARYLETLRLSYDQLLERVHPDDREHMHQFIQAFKTLPDQEVRTIDFREIIDGKVVWFRSRGKVFKRDANGQVIQYISVVQDISKERALYDQLAERTSFAEAVVESSVDAVIVLDKDYQIKTWNRRCEELYGLSIENAINKNLIELFPLVAEDATLIHSFQRAIAGEFMYLPAKLSVYTNRICEFFFVPLKNEQSEIYGVLIVIHDVSRQEEYANALQDMNLLLQQQNIELEQRNEEISTFAFVASHDLKEPLRKIHTFSDWLLERETENLSTKGQDFLKRLNLSVNRLNMLIDDILVLTKIHTDTRNNEDINLNEVLKAVEEDLEEMISKTRTSIISEPLPTITSNRNQLFYLFKNIIHNAIKFQKPGNKPFIEISADFERNVNNPLAQPKQEYLKLAFHDNGIGFDQKYERKIFKMFQQLHARGEYSGTGMGLAICRKIMENNKGFITVESIPGDGSVFYCYFPIY